MPMPMPSPMPTLTLSLSAAASYRIEEVFAACPTRFSGLISEMAFPGTDRFAWLLACWTLAGMAAPRGEGGGEGGRRSK